MRYFLVFLITIGLIVLAFVIILKSFSSAPSKPVTPLVDYSNTNTVIEMTIDGPVNDDPDHNAIQMIIGQTQNEINIIQGYQNSVIRTQSYPNNSAAYGWFLRSLDLAGYTEGKSDPNLADYRGYCSTGDVYIFQVLTGSTVVEQYWATSCGGQGTFKGEIPLVETLFQAQLPDYGSITSNLNI
ncbi:MAG TPA: hypothetical protein VMQ52_03545 [Candidatus Saccharimonadales bacterium]|jgi:hypothetical protein|nr:hypothetical protein [Candidatus Saccharimonadales bacterium]